MKRLWRGPTFVREIVPIIVWAASAVNVFIYTSKTFREVYKRPPLAAWKNMATEKGPEAGPQNPEGHNLGPVIPPKGGVEGEIENFEKAESAPVPPGAGGGVGLGKLEQKVRKFFEGLFG